VGVEWFERLEFGRVSRRGIRDLGVFVVVVVVVMMPRLRLGVEERVLRWRR
jgi:hypothetical protein